MLDPYHAESQELVNVQIDFLYEEKQIYAFRPRRERILRKPLKNKKKMRKRYSGIILIFDDKCEAVL